MDCFVVAVVVVVVVVCVCVHGVLRQFLTVAFRIITPRGSEDFSRDVLVEFLIWWFGHNCDRSIQAYKGNTIKSASISSQTKPPQPHNQGVKSGHK